MKRLTLLSLLALALLLSASVPLLAQEKPDKTLSPYFVVKSKDKNSEQMPLKYSGAEVNIAGVIADVRVSQVYENTGKSPIEAIYVFPGSTRAAVYAMTMTIGERKLIAKIEERKKAREQYEEAKEQGKTASLLEQQNPNVFQMNVANILPGDRIEVELRYTELLVPNEGVYEFTYPTVVGPRYSETPVADAQPNEEWVSNPYLKDGEETPYTFNLQTNLNAGMPIQQVYCSSHQVNVNYQGKSSANIRLDNSEKNGGNRDFILRYQLAGGKIQSGLLLYEEENAVASGQPELYENKDREKFFLLMMQPPKAPQNAQIPPREYVFILDVSGSMNGFPLEVAKEVMQKLLQQMRPEDRFNVMLFESSNKMLAPESMPATSANIQQALDVVDRQRGGGGTRLLPALKNALAFKETKDYSRTFVVVTDGYVSVEREAFDLIRNNLNEANLFAFGIGSAVNRYLIEGLANVGMGEPFIITKTQEAATVATKFKRYIENPVLTNIKIKYDGLNVYDTEPSSIPDVFAERPIIVYGKFKGTPKGKITLTGRSGGKTYSQTVNVAQAEKQNNQALKYLWARERIKLLDDYNKLSVSYYRGYSEADLQNRITSDPQNAKRIEEVTQLGLKYNLLTAYTSFIAIDNQVRNKEKQYNTVKQPLPMPEGVSNNAIGGTTAGVTRTMAPKGKGKKAKKTAYNSNQPNSANPPTSTNNFAVADEVAETVSTKEIVEEAPVAITRNAAPSIGQQAYEQYLKNNLRYPPAASQNMIEGEVKIQFVVNEDGRLSDFKVIKGLGFGCDQEAIRLLQAGAKWLSALQNGQPLKETVTLSIRFKMPR